jgi:hypothetical protein
MVTGDNKQAITCIQINLKAMRVELEGLNNKEDKTLNKHKVVQLLAMAEAMENIIKGGITK